MQQEYDVDVEWKAFDLRPDTPPGGMPRKERPGQSPAGQPVDGHLGDLAREAGITMIRAPFTPYTRPAMQAGEYAKTVGKFDELHLGLFKAYWERGANLGDMAVLKQEAAAVGLDADDMEATLATGVFATEVQEQVDFAHRVGITGIPAFIVDGRYLLVGAQPYETFKQVMAKVLEERKAALGEG